MRTLQSMLFLNSAFVSCYTHFPKVYHTNLRLFCLSSSVNSILSTSKYVLLSEALLLQGPVMTGYGRGSKKLGFPTANLPHFNTLLNESELKNGVYFGWAQIDSTSGTDTDTAVNQIYPVVANIGYSPTFVNQENKIKIIEAYLISSSLLSTSTSNTEDTDTVALQLQSSQQRELKDFYGKNLRVFLTGFLRQEQKFSSLDALKSQIQSDVDLTKLLCELAMVSDKTTIEDSRTKIMMSDESSVKVLMKSYEITKKVFNYLANHSQLLHHHHDKIKSTINNNDTTTISDDDDDDDKILKDGLNHLLEITSANQITSFRILHDIPTNNPNNSSSSSHLDSALWAKIPIF